MTSRLHVQFTGKAFTTDYGPIRLLCSHLDHLASFYLHQLTEVLLQQAGVGAPLQQAQQIHWGGGREKIVDIMKQRSRALPVFFQFHRHSGGEITKSSFQQMTVDKTVIFFFFYIADINSVFLQLSKQNAAEENKKRRSFLRFKAQPHNLKAAVKHCASGYGSINHPLHLHRHR